MNVQFIGEHLLEINPRISTIVYQDDLNLPYLAVRHAVGELDEEQLARVPAGACARRGARCATTTRSSTTSRERRRRSQRAPEDARQPVGDLRHRAGRRALRRRCCCCRSTRATSAPARSANVGQVVALVAVGATVAQLGLVNALFRFAAEREGDARFAVARTAIALCAAAGIVAGRRSRRSRRRSPRRSSSATATRRSGSWPAAGCSSRCSTSPRAGLYRVEQRPQRFLAVTLVNVVVTVVVSVVWIVHFDGGALGLMAGSYTGTLVALLVVLWDRRRALFGPDRPRARRAAAALRPAVHALARGALGAQPLQPPARRVARVRARSRACSSSAANVGLGGRAARDRVPARLAAVRLRHQGRRRGPRASTARC